MVFEDNPPCTRKLSEGAVALGFMVYLVNALRAEHTAWTKLHGLAAYGEGRVYPKMPGWLRNPPLPSLVGEKSRLHAHVSSTCHQSTGMHMLHMNIHPSSPRVLLCRIDIASHQPLAQSVILLSTKTSLNQQPMG